MAAKTSQLQIRVTEEEKAALKRLARAADLSVSRYVLAQALPSTSRELSRLLTTLAAPGAEAAGTLSELAALIAETLPEEFAEALASPPLEQLSALARNQVAALVEQASHAKRVEPPAWVRGIAPLSRPHFAWSLVSLQPHQLRVSPIPFKRRGIFFDPATRKLPSISRQVDDQALPPDLPKALRRLTILSRALLSSELKVEFYFIGGAVLSTTFHARPSTAHVSALFRSSAEAVQVVRSLGEQEGWEGEWLSGAVRDCLDGGLRPDRYVDLPGLAVFVPSLEYVLALKVAALRHGTSAAALDDLRYLLRGLNLGSAQEALGVARRYFGPRQLPAEAESALEGLLAG